MTTRQELRESINWALDHIDITKSVYLVRSYWNQRLLAVKIYASPVQAFDYIEKYKNIGPPNKNYVTMGMPVKDVINKLKGTHVFREDLR